MINNGWDFFLESNGAVFFPQPGIGKRIGSTILAPEASITPLNVPVRVLFVSISTILMSA